MNSSSKPRVLMLHGGGVSADIFTIQTRKVLWKLRPYFDFVFVDAPWISPPGPGVLPIFADAGPFYRWSRLHANEDPKRLTDKLRAVLSTPGGEWVGILGFSQGGRVTAGLCWTQEHEANGLEMLVPGLKFKFAVLVGAVWPLLLPFQQTIQTPSTSQKENLEWDDQLEASIKLPSVHCIGQQDSNIEMAKLNAKCWDPTVRTILEPDIGHQMPLDDTDNAQFCDAILEAYKQGGGVLQEFPE